MKIYFDGCSWTEAGNLENKYKERFSRLVSNHFGAEEYNFGLSGGSNDRIVRNLLVEKNIENYDLAVIQMTFPARTEYYGGVPRHPKVFKSGWIRVNPSWNIGHMIWKMKTNTLEEDVLNKRGTKNRIWTDKKNSRDYDQHRKFWSDYYRTVTTQEFFENKEKIHFQTVMNHCEVKKVPLVICTINPQTKENFELQLNSDDKGHPDAEGHRIISDKIIEVAKGKL